MVNRKLMHSQSHGNIDKAKRDMESIITIWKMDTVTGSPLSP